MSAETPKSIPWTDRGALAGSIKAPAAPQPRSSRDVEILRSLAKRINPHDAGAHNNLGVVYYNKGLYPEAIVHFEKALELDGRMHVAERNLQIAYFHTGFYETMVTELQERLRHNPHDSEAHDRLARAHFYGGDVPSAIAEWRKAIEARPGSFDLHMRLARAEQQRGSLDMALLELNAALKLEPRSARAHLLRGEVLYQTGETAQARQALETAISLDNAIAEAHHLLAFVYGELGEQQRAESSAARAAELNPSYGKAQTNLSLDSYNSARYAELIGERTRPETAEDGTLAHYNMGLEFRQKALYDDALREFRLATERGEDKLLVGSAEAEMLLLRGDSEAAAKLYEDLVQEEPTSPKLWNELGVARHQAGNLDEAERAYRHALDLDPDYALAWNNLAVARHHRGDAHESESAFRAALAHGRAIADVWRNLGLMLMRSGRLEHALDAYKRALEADPESALAYAGLGMALMDSARPAEAKAALVRAVEIDPNLPEARYHLAFALSALGDYQGALRETKLALDLNPYIPQPRYKLLIDLQFEEASVLAPELDTAQRVMAPGGESIPQFEFKPESLDAAFDSALPETAGASSAAAASEASAQDGVPLLEEARKSLALGKLEDATEQAQRALRAGADRREFLLLQGDIYARRGLAGEAVERFTGALAEVTAHSDPSSEVTEDIVRRALAGAARCFLELGKMGEAVEAAERLCAMSPDDGSALRLLGRSLARVSDYQRAVMVLEQARTIDGGGDASLLTELGSAYLGAGQRAEAEHTLRKAVELDEFAVGARVTLGRLLAASHRNEEAARELRAALEFLPSHGEAAFALAELERRQGNLRAAIDVMIDLLTVDPYHLDALVGLGALLVEHGREDQAQLAFERVLRFDPRHEVAARALAQLRTHEPVHAG